MASIIPKTRRGMFCFIAVIIYIISQNWPVMKWVYLLQKPPDIVYVLGFPFAIFWSFFACVIMIAIWVYTMLTLGEDIAKNVEQNEKFREIMEK
ncbi:hypothetical protein HQ584_12035 [Patescibacteria group bacterium]|nr:hypothetical protein [Patescibacteria group bacterium]